MNSTPHTQRRAVLPLIGLVASAVVLVALLVLVLILRDTFDPQARAERAAAAVRAAQINSSLTGVDVTVAALWRLLPLALVAGVGGVGLAALWRRWVPTRSLERHFDVLHARALNQHPSVPVTQTLTYHAPAQPKSLIAGGALLRAQDEAEDESDEPAPTFAGLLEAGEMGRNEATGKLRPLILGYDRDTAIKGDWKSLYSAGLGGLQGSGKSWTAACLLAQSALAGAQLVICDPHAGDEESLAQRIAPLAPSFLCDIAEDERDILQAVKLANAELQRRKHGHADRTPLIVAIDEWSSLRRGELAELLPSFVEDFSTEGRKLNCHVMLLGQRWDKSSVGDFRNTLASSYIHRMRPAEARMMSGLNASSMPADTLSLAPGQAYLLDTRGALTKVRLPLITAADMRAVGVLLATNNGQSMATNDGDSLATAARSMGFKAPASQSHNSHKIVIDQPAARDDYSAAASPIVNSPEAARIVALFLDGKDAGQIVTELTGMTSKSGKPYMTKLAEVQAVIRDALRARK